MYFFSLQRYKLRAEELIPIDYPFKHYFLSGCTCGNIDELNLNNNLTINGMSLLFINSASLSVKCMRSIQRMSFFVINSATSTYLACIISA